MQGLFHLRILGIVKHDPWVVRLAASPMAGGQEGLGWLRTAERHNAYPRNG